MKKDNKQIFVRKRQSPKSIKNDSKVQIKEQKDAFYDKNVVFSQKVFFKITFFPSFTV